MGTIGVVIPTKNSYRLLPGHVDSLSKWIEAAAEVVVVDSYSQDGTFEFLEGQLRHPNVRFLRHPPGLYESWNHGLQSLKTDFAYISTVGDSITRAGICHLCETMAALEADVLLSRPTLVSEEGRAMGDWPLPLDSILQDHDTREPFRLNELEMAIYVTLYPDGGMLGSSASNLYRAAFVQAHPFPTDYGPAGDGVWAVAHVFDARWAVTPLKVSTFLKHSRSHHPPRSRVRMEEVLREALRKALHEGAVSRDRLEALDLFEAMEASAVWLALKDEFDAMRRRRWPWVLAPSAWQTRYRRERSRAALNAWKQAALAKLKE